MLKRSELDGQKNLNTDVQISLNVDSIDIKVRKLTDSPKGNWNRDRGGMTVFLVIKTVEVWSICLLFKQC